MRNSYRKKRISILTGRIMGQGGTETVLTNITNNIALNKEFSFYIFITEHPISADLSLFIKSMHLADKIKVNTNRSWMLHNIFIIWYLITTRSDIIIGMKPRYIQMASFIKKYFKKKYKIVSWIHFSLHHMPGEGNTFGKMQSYLPLADAHLAISSGIVDELEEIGVGSERVSVIYNPLSKQKVTILPPRKESKPHFIYVGRLYNEQKNIFDLLDILSSIKFDYELDIFGTGPDEDIIRKRAEKIIENRITIRWHGWVNNPWNEIVQADALLLTSNYEGFPMTLLESISRGLPVITYDSPVGPKDIVINEKNGYIVPLGSHKHFLDSIVKILNRENFSDRKKIKDSLDFLYGEVYTERFKRSINDILSR